MIKLTRAINATLISTLILSTACIHSMKLTVRQRTKTQRTRQFFAPEEYKKYKQQALQAEEYNQNNPLTCMPHEILGHIYYYCQMHEDLSGEESEEELLEKKIKFFMRLNTTCKKINQSLTFEAIGKLCKNYALIDKTDALQQLLETTTSLNYKVKRLPALILVCAGANLMTNTYYDFLFQEEVSNSDFLLQKAVFKNDIQMVETLFKHHASADVMLIEHVKYGHDALWNPLFFHIKTTEIARMFIKQGVHAHIPENDCKAKIFHQIIEDAYPSEIMALYLEHNIDAVKINFSDHSCMLHIFANPFTMRIDNIENFLTKGMVMLNAMPDMVNVLNNYGQTPLDVAQKSLKASNEYGTPQAFQKLIALFREYGGKTIEELEKEALPSCIICLDKQKDIVEVPCVNKHDNEHMCLVCYSTHLEENDDCPLCRGILKT